MSIRRVCAYMLMTGGMLLFVGGASQSEAQMGGTAGSSAGGSGSVGGSSGTMKQGHESSGKMGQNSPPITEEDPGGIVTRGGRGDIPSSSKADPLKQDLRDESTKSGPGGVPGSKSSKGSSGNKGSSGSMGSSGGTGSSGGGGGY